MNEKKETLDAIYRAAVGAGMCTTLKEFAELLDINRSGLSAAMNGNEKYLTDSLVRKAKIFADRNGLTANTTKQKVDNRPGVIIPAATLDLYTNLSESIKNLSEMLNKMQSSAPTAIVVPTQKNSRAD